MNVSKKTLFFTLLLSVLLFCHQGFAQNSGQDVSGVNRVGTTAAQFLKIGVGGRAIGLGGSYTAVANDISSVFWNPAGLARIPGNGEATFNHAEWLVDTDFDFAAFSLNVGGLGSLAVHVISFRVPEEPVRTVNAPDGNGQFWDASSISMGVTFSRSLTDRFSIGFTGKFVQENIFNVSARGAAFDLGVLYDTPVKNLTLGATISNFGTKMRLNGRDLFINVSPSQQQGAVDEVPAEYRTESYDMPLNLKFGLSWMAHRDDNFSMMATVDGSQPNDNNESINSGLEIGVKDVVFLRAGYKALLLENSEQGLTFGAGIRYDAVGTNMSFDFGWADYGLLENVKFVSLGVRY